MDFRKIVEHIRIKHRT